MNLIIATLVISFILIGITAALVRTYNNLIMLKFNVEKAYANIDVILKQRADEIPNLIQIVKQYMKYEEQTLIALSELRTKFLDTKDLDEKVAYSNELSRVLKSVFSITENYPDLKANHSFIVLQERVSKLEDHISDRREFFNESINMYNIGCFEFPSILFAKILDYKPKSSLLITNSEKEYDGVKF
jgi:LemA protein